MGKVYLTGAGPGDPELLTLKALRVVREADVILHDRLVNEEILKETKKNAKLIYVGKADGRHTIPQDEINELIYQNALVHDRVVRLKGGDPFVFGRGGEEALYLAERGIGYEIIPGVTSAISVPAYAGIPVTQRGVNTSFRVVTGHQASCPKCGKDHPFNVGRRRENETLVILMGLNGIDKIVDSLLKNKIESHTPCAVIQDGTTPKQRVVVGTVADIAQKAKDKGLGSPAIIVVGEVVDLRPEIGWFQEGDVQ